MAARTISAGDRPKRATFVKKRFLIALMTVLCPIVCYISRQNLSMAIVAMVDDDSSGNTDQDNLVGQHAAGHSNSTATIVSPETNKPPAKFNTCPAPVELDESSGGRATTVGPKYNWNQSQRSLPFEAFFWTYVLFQIPCARLAEQLGAKWILAAATVGSSLLSLISPWAASIDSLALAAVRALMGIVQTALFPACYVICTKWLPPRERSQVLPIVMVGAYVGSVVASSSTGYFSEQPNFGWPYAFYLPAVLCAIWSLVWFYSGTSEPRQHSTISLEELEFIESHVAPAASGANKLESNQVDAKKSICWSKILKSKHVWAMNAAMFASNWSFAIVLLLLPTYLNSVLHIPPFKNGMINSVIYVLYCITSPLIGSCSTVMIETRPLGMSRLNIRKLFESISLFGQAICFASLPLIGCDTTLVLAVLFGQIVLFSFNNGGEVQIPSELSVDFAGTIYAIGNCIGSTTGFIAPRVHSLIVDNPRDMDLWNLYFYLAAFVCALGGLVFLLFGQNELQDYSKGAQTGKFKRERQICRLKRGSLSHPFADVYLDPSAEAKSWRQIDIDTQSNWLGSTN